MADSPEKHEKVFDPTPQRLRKAREEGNVFKSREIVSVGLLIVGLGVLVAGVSPGFGILKDTAASIFRGAATTPLNAMSVPALFMNVGSRLLIVILPFFAVLIVAAVGLSVMQSGWNVTLKPLAPKGSRINPIEGLKRLFSPKGMADVVKSLAKVAIVGPIAYWTISGHMPQIVMLHRLPLEGILATAGTWVLVLLAKILLVLLVLSGFDFAFEKWRYTQDLKMTAKEIKDEAKDTEGDPQIKGKRRQIARERARRPRLDHAVLQADVVVTNPTHYAVALRYDPNEAPAPRVLVKGIRKRALRIKALAAENNIPTVEDRALARALYEHVPEAQEISEELYPAVAAILAEIYRRRENRP